MLRALVKPFQHSTLEHRELENDEFQFHYTASERPHIQNDTITINHRFAHDHLLKLSISHALSQSTKLCVFEERVLEIVQSTRDLPERLASSGSFLMGGARVMASQQAAAGAWGLAMLRANSHAGLSQSTKLCKVEEPWRLCRAPRAPGHLGQPAHGTLWRVSHEEWQGSFPAAIPVCMAVAGWEEGGWGCKSPVLQP